MLLWLVCDRCALLLPCAWAIWRSTKRPDDRYSSCVVTRQVSTNRWWKMLAKSQKWVKTFWKTSVVPRQLEFRAWGMNCFVSMPSGEGDQTTQHYMHNFEAFLAVLFTILLLNFCYQFCWRDCVCFRSLEVNGGPPPNIYSSSRASEYLIAAVAVSCSAACVCCVVATDLLFDVVLLKLTNFSLLVESNQSTSISF